MSISMSMSIRIRISISISSIRIRIVESNQIWALKQITNVANTMYLLFVDWCIVHWGHAVRIPWFQRSVSPPADPRCHSSSNLIAYRCVPNGTIKDPQRNSVTEGLYHDLSYFQWDNPGKPNTFHNMFHLHKHVSPQQEAKFLRQTRRKAQPQHRHLEEGRLLKP